MIKKDFSIMIFILCMTLINIDAYAQDLWSGNVNFLLGAKALDKDDWEPAEEQSEFGVEIDFKNQNWPFSIAIDILGAVGEGNEYSWAFGNMNFESTTSEINIGIKKIWDKSPIVRPFLGGGLSIMTAEADVTVLGIKVTDDDNATGFWFGGGVYWTISNHFNIGLEGKYSTAEVTLYDVDGEAGGGHFGLLLGYHW